MKYTVEVRSDKGQIIRANVEFSAGSPDLLFPDFDALSRTTPEELGWAVAEHLATKSFGQRVTAEDGAATVVPDVKSVKGTTRVRARFA